MAIGAGAPVIPGLTRGQITGRILLYAVMVAIALLFLVPFLWSVSTSFMPLPETNQGFHLIPNDPTISAYRDLLTNPVIDFARAFGNSWLLAGTITLTNLVLASLGGYAFARLRFPGRELRWDAANYRFTNHEEANKTILKREYREGFAPPAVS